ncbi:3777_t:CDS:2, partial [Funneliformis geosporum]
MDAISDRCFDCGNKQNTQLNATANVDYLEYIDFDQFEFVEKINKGPMKVALKRLNNSQNISKSYLKQLNNYQHCLYKSFDNFFGITKEPTSNYMLIMKYYEYYENRDLYSFLDETQGILYWKDIVEMLWSIFQVITNYYEKGLIHGNLHRGNILVEVKQGSFENIDIEPYLIDRIDETNKVYGVSYIASEILQGKPVTETSDIYSFGVI